MCEILVKAQDATHPDPIKNRRGCYKRGYPVVVMPDGHPWGLKERLPMFVVIKIPTISIERVKKYIDEWKAVVAAPLATSLQTVQRRRWQIRWADLPQAARNKLASTGELTIKAGNYTGPSDYTWTQIKQYFRNLETELDETEDL